MSFTYVEPWCRRIKLTLGLRHLKTARGTARFFCRVSLRATETTVCLMIIFSTMLCAFCTVQCCALCPDSVIHLALFAGRPQIANYDCSGGWLLLLRVRRTMKHSFANSKGIEFTVHRKWRCWQTLDSNSLAGKLLTGKLNPPQVAVVTCALNKIYFAIQL